MLPSAVTYHFNQNVENEWKVHRKLSYHQNVLIFQCLDQVPSIDWIHNVSRVVDSKVPVTQCV